MNFEYLLQGIPPEWEEHRKAAIMAAGGEAGYNRLIEERKKKELQEAFVRDRIEAVRKMAGRRLADCTFENFIVNDNNRKAYEMCCDLAENFRIGRKGILLSGNNGIGKNHLAIAVCKKLAERVISTFYASAITLKNRMFAALYDEGVEGIVNRILSASLICINDLGAEADTDNGFVSEFFTGLVDKIYENGNVLFVSTNLNSDEMVKRYGIRVMSRLLGMCDVVTYKDYDHRIRRDIS